MKLVQSILVLVCVTGIGASQTPDGNQTDAAVPEVFRSVLPLIKSRARLPILLPSEYPLAAGVPIVASQKATQDAYEISLWIAGSDGLPTFFASMFAAMKDGEIPDGRKVPLENGIEATFWPISCGGSCAPVNLWWMKDQIAYHIQLELSSTTNEQEQQKKITDIANSAIRAGPR